MQRRHALVVIVLAIGLVAAGGLGETVMESNKKVVRAYVDAFNVGDLERLRETFAPDAQVHGVLGWGSVDAVMPIWRQLVDSLAIELEIEIEEMIAEGDRVAVRYRERGTARAAFFGKPATGRSYELVAMEWFVLRDGKIVRRWGARDATTQAEQLGWTVPASRTDVEHEPAGATRD